MGSAVCERLSVRPAGVHDGDGVEVDGGEGGTVGDGRGGAEVVGERRGRGGQGGEEFVGEAERKGLAFLSGGGVEGLHF